MVICNVMKHSNFAVPRQISRISCHRDGIEDEVETEAKEPRGLGIGGLNGSMRIGVREV